MGTSFSRLSALVATGSLRVIELQAVPRSMSTALGRCLNESGATSVFVNEPFSTSPHDVDVAAGHILQWVQPALSSAQGPVIVVSKNMARFLSAPVLRTWTDVCEAVVWCVRDPRPQILSLVTRTVNDQLFGIGADRLKQCDLLPWHLEMATELLQNSVWSTDFSKTGWRAIGEHFNDCAEGLPAFVADGSLFRRVPDRFLQYLCAGLGLEFRNRMINGWSEPFLNVDGIEKPYPTDPAVDAWIKQAATSCGVEPAEQVVPEVQVLPAALRNHLFEVAVPTYDMFMRAFASQNNLAPYGLAPIDHP
jgi:hypothetical protein